MPESTSNVGLRYPTPTESNDVPADVQRLAEDVDELFPDGRGTFQKRLYFHLTETGGAVGQDATADTSAWIEGLKSPWPMWVPDGRFYVNEPFDSAVEAPTKTDWVIDGPGRDRAIVEWVGTDGETMLRLTTADGTTSDGVDDSGTGGRVNISDVGFTTNATRGHTSQTYYSYTTTSTDHAGTQGATVGLHLDDLSSRGINLTRVGFTDFGTAVLCDNGTFLFDARGLWIRWCNIGVDWNDIVTASTIADGSSIERCAIGVRTRFASGNSIEDCVIQANYAGTDILTYTKTKYLSIKRNYFEASRDPGVHLAGTGVDTEDVTRNIFIEENFGVEVRCRNHVRDVWIRDNNLRGLDNEYTEQTGRRGIWVGENRHGSGDQPFTQNDVTGAQADEVTFVGTPEGRDYTETSETIRLDKRSRVYHRNIGGSASTEEQLAAFTVPPSERAWIVEVEGIKTRAPSSDVGTSRVFKAVFAIARNGSGADVVTDHVDTAGYEVTTSDAGGDKDANVALSWDIRRVGTEPSDADQEVEIVFDARMSGGTSGFLVATMRVIGHETAEAA